VSGHIAPNVSFLLDGQVEYTTGDIPQTNTWISYGFNFSTQPGQTSLTLTLQNNAPGGIGNDLGLDNISFRACGPEALILPETIANICEDGDPITLDATINGNQFPNPAIQWQRSNDEGITWEDIPGENGLSYVHNELASGFYYYRYLIANSPANLSNPKCRINSNVKIINVVPKFYEITDTLCEGLTLELSSGVYSETGIYVDSLISSIGCDSIVTVDLTILPDSDIQATVAATPPACAQDSNGTIAIVDIQGGYSPVTVDLQGIQMFSDTLYVGLENGTYELTLTDRYGCTSTESIILEDPDAFSIELGDDLFVELGDLVTVETSANQPIVDFTWTPAVAAECSDDCLELEWAPPFTATYILEAVSPEGCIATDSIRIVVEPVRKLFIPNAFSPNGDGFNDRFVIFGAEPNVQLIESMQIYNRWGSLVYEGGPFAPNDRGAGWNGRFGEKELGSDVYLYVVKVRYLDGVVETKTGDILLLR
jgi:gliding motility-associated-like protein